MHVVLVLDVLSSVPATLIVVCTCRRCACGNSRVRGRRESVDDGRSRDKKECCWGSQPAPKKGGARDPSNPRETGEGGEVGVEVEVASVPADNIHLDDAMPPCCQ